MKRRDSSAMTGVIRVVLLVMAVAIIVLVGMPMASGGATHPSASQRAR